MSRIKGEKNQKQAHVRRTALLVLCLSALAGGVAVRLSLERTPAVRSAAPSSPLASYEPSVSNFSAPPPAAASRSIPTGQGALKRPSPAPSSKKSAPSLRPDLSAYKPRARGAEGESYLPDDRSLRAKDLKKTVASPPEEEGKGFLHDVVRGAQKAIETVDDATLEGAKWALGDVASPDRASIRPDGDGLKLHIDIPAHTVQLRK